MMPGSWCRQTWYHEAWTWSVSMWSSILTCQKLQARKEVELTLICTVWVELVRAFLSKRLRVQMHHVHGPHSRQSRLQSVLLNS